MTTHAHTDPEIKGHAYQAGTYLRCAICFSEVQIIKPCSCHPPDQVIRCCNQDMEPARLEGERGFLG
jgi:hypothetical protein